MKPARDALECFALAEYGPHEDWPKPDQILADLIRDLMHTARADGIDFGEALDRGLVYFEEECDG